MRWLSFRAMMTAAAIALAMATARGQNIDALDSDAPSRAPAALPVSTSANGSRLDKSPTGSLGQPTQRLGDARPASETPVAPSVAAEDKGDPDVDGIVKPATPAPSKDPLDSSKAEAPKAEAPKTEAPKTDQAKPGEATAGDSKSDVTKATPDAKPPAQAVGASATPGAPPTPVADAPPPLPALNAAIKAALEKRAATEIRGAQAGERRKERAAVDVYYEAHGYEPVWSEAGASTAAVAPVVARLAKAGDDALTIAAPPKLVAQGSPDEIAASDIALTEAVVAYARQATGSRVDPRAISPLIGARPELADPAEVIDTIAAAGPAAGDALAALNPIDPRYAALRDKLVALRGARVASVMPISPGPTLKIGMKDARIPKLRARFGLAGGEGVYDIALAEAVSGFQRAAGLPVSGSLTQRTVAALAGSGKSSAQEAPIAANMELWRWMPRDLGRNRIEVDVPAFTVTVYHDGEPVATNRVVVGKTETPTPIFSNTMKYLIVNPVWNVPESIIKKEFLPKGEGYMVSHGFDVSYRHGRLVVKQPSGEKNALGRIKFMFPNDFSVYLHDTPSKSLFAASKRAFSHGCVRVDQPFDFAFNVLNDSVPEGGKILWSEKRLDSLLGDKERYVNLPKPLPIHIEYFTMSVDPESGRLVHREDIYGYAREVAAALGLDSAPALVAERKPRRIAASAKTSIAVDEDPR